MATAYAALEVIPTVRSVRSLIERQVTADLTAVGQKAGRDAGSSIASGIGSANYETAGRSAGTRVGAGLKTTGAKAGRDAGQAIASGMRSADYTSAGRDAAGRFRAGLMTGSRSAGRDAGKAITDGVRNENYESSGRSAAERVRNGFTSGLTGIGVGLSVGTQGLRLFAINASAIATTMGIAARVVRSFSAATFISALALRAVASTGLARLAGMLRLIAGIASRVAGEIGQVTAAFLALQGVVRIASMMKNFARTLSLITVGGATAIGVISGLGVAFVSLATAVAAAVASAAGAAAGIVGPAVAALKIGFSGLGEAKKAFETPPSGDGGASQAKAVASAAKSLASAEKAVTKAKEDALDAEEDLTKAREEAQQQIDDLNKSLRDNALNERQAARDVRSARQQLAETLVDPKASADDREEAADRVQRAELDLIEVQERNREETEAADKANRDGVEGSEQVVAAKEKVRDANEAVTEATERAAEAVQALAEAQNEQSSGGGSTVDPFYAMIGARMAPMLNAVDALKRAVTDDFSAALVPAFANVGTILDTLSPKLAGLSGVLGRIGVEVSNSLAGPVATAAFDQMTAASSTFFGALSAGENGLGGLTVGLAQFAATAASTVAGSGGGLNTLLLNLGERLGNISGAQITATFDRIQQIFANIGAVAGPLFGLFAALGGVSSKSLAPGFVAIGKGVQDATPGLIHMAEIIMPALGQVMERLSPLIPALVNAFTPWSSVLATIAPPLATVLSHVAPLAPYLLAAATAAKVIGAAIWVWNVATFAASVAQGVFAAAMGRSAWSLRGNTVALIAHRIALIAGAVAAHAFGAAMTFATSPIGIIILAVAAIGVALWAFFTKTETGRKMWEKIWPAIKTAVAVVWEWLKVAWQWILDAIGWIGDKAMWLWQNAIQPAFSAIGALISSWWTNIVQPAFEGVKTVLGVVGAAITWWWQSVVTPAFNAVGAVIGWWWNNVVTPAFAGVKAAFEVVGNVISWWWKSIVTPAFNAVSAIISFWWDNFGSPIFNNFKVLIGLVGEAVSSWWNSSVKPAFELAGDLIGWWWNTIVGPAFDLAKAGVGLLGDAFSDWWNSKAKPAWDLAQSAIGAWWDFASGMFDKIKGGISLVGDAFGAASNVIKTAWSGIADGIRPAVRSLGDILAGLPEKMFGFEIPGAAAANSLGKKLQAFRTGGLFQGVGTGTSDSNLALLSNREFVVNALATGKNLPLLEAINSGWTPPPWLLDLMVNGLPGFATGGLVDVQKFLREQAGMKYQYGGTGNPSWDCSGIAGGAWAKAVGKPTNARYFTTDSDFGALGWQPGPGGPADLTIGTNGGSGTGGHMAGRAGDLVFESSGTDGVEVGPNATDPSKFPTQWHWPIGGNPLSSGAPSADPGWGGGLGSGTGGVGSGTSGGTSGGVSSSGTGTRPSGTAVLVWVDNMPANFGTASASSTASTDTSTPAASTTGTADQTDGTFDQAAAINAAFAKFNGAIGKAGEGALRGQASGIPGIGGQLDGIEKTVNNWQILTADVYGAFERIAREQRRQTAGK